MLEFLFRPWKKQFLCAVSEEDFTNLPPHLREQTIVSWKNSESADGFFQYKRHMIGQTRGPECFPTRQAAFVLQRSAGMRRSNRFELANEMELIHVDLLRGVSACGSPEGYAEQFFWT